MPTEYVNRARRTSDSVLVYWTTIGAADPTLAAGNAPSPADDYADPVVVLRRPAAPEIRQASLSLQVDGSAATTSPRAPTGRERWWCAGTGSAGAGRRNRGQRYDVRPCR